jgi:molybdate transport system regulatory protein
VPRRRALAKGLTHLRVTISETFYVGPGRADLIELIAETGSISEAARRMGMSYKRAWGLVQALNQGFGAPLIETQRGGVGQGAVVTDAGREVVARYRHMQQATGEAIAADVEALTQLVSDMLARK